MRGRHAVPGERRGFLQPALLTLAAVVALAATGGVATLTGWTTGSAPETFTVYAGKIPRMDQPRVHPHAHPRISWTSVQIAPDVPVQRYVVTRHLGAVAQVACDVPAASARRCVDRYAPAGYRATYTVSAAYGPRWVGPDSEHSAVVAMPGVAVPILVDGVTIVPGVAGAPVVVGTVPRVVPTGASSPASAPPDPAASATGPQPDPEPSEPLPPPPVIVPPAPPEAKPDEEPVKEPEKEPGKPERPEKELPLPAVEHLPGLGGAGKSPGAPEVTGP
jgi:hypothetical protein